ncbi:calcium:proton antiporter [Luteibacter rhizovicinus DSM 16549]|uniref:Calcium:proton antiporter n=1 Tax=Luteibacter rhizovicinus DSM 16549 TaxID=1440763 RepID=A0A0G9H3M6_9GAMM|nr:calcium:proton antiporter [Luteibacter rhizovicinus]APG05481.1 calcium:proton antiporter [Luteibacter rhizovicinus DSM 16549]KLD63814.1 calcium:proton antiporter [Luteibacter rhizovicinus DSM 16549]KLD79459.1 calcium:proton antiporter [Xanthomonas hyacinthi DSM 19077]
MSTPVAFAREEWFLVVTVATCAVFLGMHDTLLAGLESRSWLIVVFIWLFVVILGSALAVLRHAERLARYLGEPIGTLVLTIAVTSIEIMSISAVMLHGANNPTLARDTLFSVTMIVLNGMVGLSLLWGGWKHREQAYNLQGANAYLGLIIPLGVLGLVLPRFTHVAEGAPLPLAHQMFLVVVMLTLYATFLGLQAKRLKGYFTTDASTARHGDPEKRARHGPVASAVLLIAYMIPVVFLVDQLAIPVDYVVETLNAPAAMGGLAMAILVALPEGMGAIRAASRNDLQRAVNIFLGSVLSTIGLTIPGILLIGQMTHHPVILGLEHTDLILFVLTLVLSLLTFSSARTHLLQGAVHLTVFVCFVYFLFSP